MEALSDRSLRTIFEMCGHSDLLQTPSQCLEAFKAFGSFCGIPPGSDIDFVVPLRRYQGVYAARGRGSELVSRSDLKTGEDMLKRASEGEEASWCVRYTMSMVAEKCVAAKQEAS